MGRIKTKQIKRLTGQLVKKHREEFTRDYKENKEIIPKFADIPSKKMRNVLAGYITHVIKKGE